LDSTELIEKIRLQFGGVIRPEHFTDHNHCCECAEHDETLRDHTVESIGMTELGNPGWDPICFATDEAFRYYFPALVRLTLEGTEQSDYTDQFLFHITYDGEQNRRWKSFNDEERRLVVALLEYLLEARGARLEEDNLADDLFTALEIWSEKTG
jgi:hypothetical protein